MPSMDLQEVTLLSPEEAGSIHGGDFGATVVLGVAIASAMGAGFVWGYKHLGPVLNRYF